ncbi:MAG: phosphoribosyltransferase [Acidimicrobiia bacterium]
MSTADRAANDPDDKYEVLTWSLFGEAIKELAVRVAESGFEPDIILAIARGGLIPAGTLGYMLSVKNTFTMNVEYYTGVDERLDMPVILPPYLDLVDLEDRSFLVVDDVADTGHTLQMVQEFCSPKVGEVRTAVLYHKPHSVIRPDFVWRDTDKWILFPWSSEDPVAQPKDGSGAVPEK